MNIISSLPDPILCHILSFLPVHYSVKTSVLARRWRFLWTSVRSLHFEEPDYDSKKEKIMGFPDMVYRVLLLHDGPIDSLSICPWPHEDPMINHCQIDAWISTAIARNVQVLHLSDISEVPIPERCFKCKTLVELTIERCTISVKPGAVCLYKLKKLNLLSNCYEDAESLPNLVSGCLAVENLIIERDMLECDMVCCQICSPTLKSLALTCSVECYESDHEHKLVLDLPAVQYLRICDDISCVIWAEELSSLVEADIWLSYDFLSRDSNDFLSEDEDLSEDEENISRWRDTFHFMEKLSNAKSLTFRSSALMKLFNPTFSIATTRFHNLTQLKLEADWHILIELLESAYKLELLTIQKVEDELKCWREPEYLPVCLSSSLKYVYIFGFAGGENELNMVRYILKNAERLKTIKIHFGSHYHDSKLYMLQRISYFPRASEKCQLILA